jgi:hypothetical protein
MPWFRAAAVWMLIMLAETAHGLVREIFIAPALGALRARQLGVIVGCVLVLLIAWACRRWMKLPDRRSQWWVGGFWVLLTVTFELAVGRAMDLSWARILSDYNPVAGGFMLPGLAVMFAAPRWTR